jgi:hypothetical protein
MPMIPLCNCTAWCGELTITDPSIVTHDSVCECINLIEYGDRVAFNAVLEPDTKYVLSFCVDTIANKKLRVRIVTDFNEISTPYQFKDGINDQTVTFTSGSSSDHHITFTVTDFIDGNIKLHNIRFDKVISLIHGDCLIDVRGPDASRIQKRLSELVVGVDQVYHPSFDMFGSIQLIEPYRNLDGTSDLHNHPSKPLNKSYFTSCGPNTTCILCYRR